MAAPVEQAVLVTTSIICVVPDCRSGDVCRLRQAHPLRDYILFYVNGQPQRASGEVAMRSLSRYLRYDLRATGTKIVCEEGDCGACTVLIGRIEDGALRYRAINSCITFLFQLDCAHVVSVEGLARGGDLTPLQDAMVRCHGAQCGYCTPGFIMAMAAMYEPAGSIAAGPSAVSVSRPAGLTARDVRSALTGNLCRCTGYEPIIKAALEVEGQPDAAQLYPSEPIIRALQPRLGDAVRIGNFFKPSSLPEAIEFKAANPKCVIVQGATDFGVWCNKRGFVPEAMMSLDGVEGLGEIDILSARTTLPASLAVPAAQDGMNAGHLDPTRSDASMPAGDVLRIGGRVTLSQLEEFVRGKLPSLEYILDRFGSPQIKNAGTLAGNIANASPIADTLPFLYVTEARLELTGRAGARLVPIASFYRGYKTLDLRPDEIITQVLIFLPSSFDTLRLYKVSKRSHLDISSFTAAMLMRRAGDRIDQIRIAYGGVGPVVLRLPRTESFLTGKSFALGTLEDAAAIAREEITPISDVRGSKDFRLQLAGNVLRKFYYDVTT